MSSIHQLQCCYITHLVLQVQAVALLLLKLLLEPEGLTLSNCDLPLALFVVFHLARQEVLLLFYQRFPLPDHLVHLSQHLEERRETLANHQKPKNIRFSIFGVINM